MRAARTDGVVGAEARGEDGADGAGAPLTFAASTLAVTVTAAPPAALAALRAVWGDATPLLAPERHLRLSIERAGMAAGGGAVGGADAAGGAVRSTGAVSPGAAFTVRADGVAVGTYPGEDDALPALEGELYRALATLHGAPRTLLHAAAVVVGGAPVLLVGESGAGKSSLTLALVRRGARYLTDELTALDDTRVWGVGRSVQFDSVAPGAALPPWLRETDTASYRYRARDGTPRVLPLGRVRAAERATAPASVAGVRVVLPARAGATALTAAEPVAALGALHAAHRAGRREGLARLLAAAPLALRWDDPDTAAQRLLTALAG